MSNCIHNWVFVDTEIKIINDKIVVIDSYWYCTKCLEIKK